MSILKISDNLQEIYKENGIKEPGFLNYKVEAKTVEDTQKDFCEYCNESADEDYVEKDGLFFCCPGCVEKWEEKKKKKDLEENKKVDICDTCLRIITDNQIVTYIGGKYYCNDECFEKAKKKKEFQSIETPQDIIRRLQEEVKFLKERHDDLKSLENKLYHKAESLEKENKELKNMVRFEELAKKEAVEYMDKKVESLKKEIEKLKRELTKEQQRADGYKSNAEIILPDAQKIKNEAKSELAEKNLKLRKLEEVVKKVKLFTSAAVKVADVNSPVYCLLKEIEKILNMDSGYPGQN